MTDPINPWLDAEELKQLAESLLQGGNKPRQTATRDAGFGDGFEGFATPEAPTPANNLVMATPAAQVPSAPPAQFQAAPPAQFQAAPPAQFQAAPPAQFQAAPPAQVTPSPKINSELSNAQLSPAGPEQACLQFQADMQQQFGCSKIFILNREGHTVFGKETHPQFQFIARSLTKHAERRGLPKGHIHIKVGPSQTLEIIPVDLPNGGWVVGAVVPKPMQTPEIEHWVREISKLGSTLNQL